MIATPFESAASALAVGRQAYIAFESARGPHVSPALYAWSDGRLWFAVATSTLKARVLERDRTAAAIVPLAGREVMLTGRLEAFDVRHPFDLAARATQLPQALRAAARFTVRNAPDLIGFAGDAVSGRIGSVVPPPRVLFGLAPDRVALVENDALAGSWGWTVNEIESRVAVPPGGVPAIAAFCGPVAVSCRWYEEERRLYVAPETIALSGIGARFPVAVVVDSYRAPGPAAKRGRLQRGIGVRSADGCFIDMSIDRTTEWDGIRVSSTVQPQSADSGEARMAAHRAG